jgi:hypothetical protein
VGLAAVVPAGGAAVVVPAGGATAVVGGAAAAVVAEGAVVAGGDAMVVPKEALRTENLNDRKNVEAVEAKSSTT